MPKPATWLTAYRTGSKSGLFLTLAGDDGQTVFEELLGAVEALNAETGLQLAFVRKAESPFKGTITATLPYQGGMAPSDETVLEWLRRTANALVNSFRPRLAAWSRE
jgi:hypothetical protein